MGSCAATSKLEDVSDSLIDVTVDDKQYNRSLSGQCLLIYGFLLTEEIYTYRRNIPIGDLIIDLIDKYLDVIFKEIKNSYFDKNLKGDHIKLKSNQRIIENIYKPDRKLRRYLQTYIFIQLDYIYKFDTI